MTDNAQPLPILYSFRRCPYAMRARMAIQVAGRQTELREVVLRNKPAEMLAVSPKATVPVLIDTDGKVIDESFDIMLWALDQNDPESWLAPANGSKDDMVGLIARIEGPFKEHLDRYKYANRFTGDSNVDSLNPPEHRDAAMAILAEFEERLKHHQFLFGSQRTLADIATAPFIRQFANTDRDWFASQPYPKLQAWLEAFVQSDLFLSCMEKHAPWTSDTRGIAFPAE